MPEIDELFLKTWREKYQWPFCKSRFASEEKILWLEKLVTENILNRGSWTVKDVLLEVVDWKTGGRQVNTFCGNEQEKIENKKNSVSKLLNNDFDDVSECIKVFALEDKLQGVGVPVASAFLRFLDSLNHRYGIIDKNIATLLNQMGVTNFEFMNETLANTYRNADEYERFHLWLKSKAEELKNSSFTTIYQVQARWSPVDVEMALFSYCTHRPPTTKTVVLSG